jgi:hypothetical protein
MAPPQVVLCQLHLVLQRARAPGVFLFKQDLPQAHPAGRCARLPARVN